jgi:hypothetical protein
MKLKALHGTLKQTKFEENLKTIRLKLFGVLISFAIHRN